MRTQQLVRIATGALLTLGVIALGGRWSSRLSVQAQDNHSNNDDNEASLVRIGFEIAPVPLNLTGRDPWKVGFGSFLVNAVGDCNGCHTGGGPPNFNYAAGGNPYFGQPTKTDPTTYLEGGTDFGPAVPPVPDVYTRDISATRLLVILRTIRWTRYHYAQPDAGQNGTSGRGPHA